MKKNNKGFTLAELLIVVAIIAVLVAIAIPVFTSQLEKSREATDLSNIRAAYAEVMSAALTDTAATHDSTIPHVSRTGSAGTFAWSVTVNLKQTQDGWQGPADNVGGMPLTGTTPKAGGTCTVTFTEGSTNAALAFST